MKVVAALVVLCVSGGIMAEEFDPGTIPPSQRISYVNRITSADQDAKARVHYEKAAEDFQYFFEVCPDDATSATRKRYDAVDLNLATLALVGSWSDEETHILRQWLKANDAVLAEVAKATELPTYAEWRSAKSGHVSDAMLSDASHALSLMSKAIGIRANERAMEGDWAEALHWNRRVHKLADQFYRQSTDLQQMMGMHVERKAAKQSLSFLARHEDCDLAVMLKQVEQHELEGCTTNTIHQMESLLAYEMIEMQFQWAKNPSKHPDTTQLVETYLGLNTDLEGLDVLRSDPFGLPYQTVEAYRQAVLGSSIARSWKVCKTLGQLNVDWAKQDFAVAWANVESFRKAYDRKAKTEPVQALLNSTFFEADLYSRIRALTLTHRRALSVVLRILQYKKEHGRVPKNLDLLVPTKVPSGKVDPFGGVPFVYKPSGDRASFRLYSLGWNQKDDGGVNNEAPLAPEGDLVFWPPVEPDRVEP